MAEPSEEQEKQHDKQRFQQLMRTISFGLLVAAIVKELRTPSDQRTWHGTLGFIPYDLRPPTFARVRQSLWNPEDPRLFMPQAFGVGWSVNLGRLWHVVTRAGS